MGAFMPVLGPDPDRKRPNTRAAVQRPLLKHLAAIVWQFCPGDSAWAGNSGHNRFRVRRLRECESIITPGTSIER